MRERSRRSGRRSIAHLATPTLCRTDRPELRSDSVDFFLPADDDPHRKAVREWLAEHPRPTGKELAEAGYVVPHWPRPWGLDSGPIKQLVIDEELTRAGVRRPENP